MNNIKQYLTAAKQYYDENLLNKFGYPLGVLNIEINEYELENDLLFPAAYKEYLLWMGHDKSGVFKGSNWYFTDLKSNQEILPELLLENDINFENERKFICFFSHQGYMAAWFFLDGVEDDPQCYFYSESNSLKIERFSEFLLNEIKTISSK